ncbi:dihydrolipoyl dehydrogenase [Oceanobacillus oncorhynchi subsp. oncorhynchi]|uniref:dihydrolipoyl dehydrogenase n=1 Tax=Oceanobacillus oncorhynchi TaxID=545501 RepID=UPI0031E1A76A
MEKYDVIVVGGGPGGYVSALRAAKYGKKTALVESEFLGGTCLNKGCIPSKTLLRHSEIIEDIKKAQSWGINTGELSFSFDEMLQRKDSVIQKLRNGINHLIRSGEVALYNGKGNIKPNKEVEVHTEQEVKRIQGDKIIIATGGSPAIPAIEGLDTATYHTTDTIFDIDQIPSSIAIIGGGVIGVEMANLFSSLNTEVTIIEMEKRIISTEDEEASKVLLKNLKKKGINVLTKQKVASVYQSESKKTVFVSSSNGKETAIEVEQLLLAVGRKPNLSAVEQLDIKRKGPFIDVNEYLETSMQDVFAVGDVIGGLQLAHVASAEGLTAVENLDEKRKQMNYSHMPRCIYTQPEIASVGMTEKEVKDKGITYKVNKQPLSGNGKALAMGETEGFMKIITEEKYGEILGVVLAGAHVTEMISQSASYMQLEGTVDELAELTQPHPALSEGIMETANALIGKGIHTH